MIDEAFETHRIQFTSDKAESVRFTAQADMVYLITTADCLIDFDQEATKETGHLLRVFDNNRSFDVRASSVSVIGLNEPGTLYIGVVRK